MGTAENPCTEIKHRSVAFCHGNQKSIKMIFKHQTKGDYFYKIDPANAAGVFPLTTIVVICLSM